MMLKILIAVVFVLAVSIGGNSYYKQQKANQVAIKLAQEEKAKAEAIKAEQEVQIAVAKSRIEGALKDPTSVQYRNLIAVSEKLSGASASSFSICGEMNAKNSFGGYVGFRRFLYDDSEKSVEFEPAKDASPFAQKFFEASYLLGCTPKVEYEAICQAKPERCEFPNPKLGQ